MSGNGRVVSLHPPIEISNKHISILLICFVVTKHHFRVNDFKADFPRIYLLNQMANGMGFHLYTHNIYHSCSNCTPTETAAAMDCYLFQRLFVFHICTWKYLNEKSRYSVFFLWKCDNQRLLHMSIIINSTSTSESEKNETPICWIQFIILLKGQLKAMYLKYRRGENPFWKSQRLFLQFSTI